jgi:hypothetical protein
MVKETDKETGKKTLNAMINPNIYSKESKISILIGLLLLSEAVKQLTQWSTFGIPEPLFGAVPSHGVYILISIISGIILLFVAHSFFKLNRIGYWIGIGYFTIGLISTIISWSLYDTYAEELVISRRTFQGLPVRGSEIKFMQTLFPEAILVFATLLIIGFFKVKLNFSKEKNEH